MALNTIDCRKAPSVPVKPTWSYQPYPTEEEAKILDWLKLNNIHYCYSAYNTTIYFEREEDKVKFILRWI